MSVITILCASFILCAVIIGLVIRAAHRIHQEIDERFKNERVSLPRMYAHFLQEIPIKYLTTEVQGWLEQKCVEFEQEAVLCQLMGGEELTSEQATKIQELLHELISIVESGFAGRQLTHEEHDMLRDHLHQGMVRVEADRLYLQANKCYVVNQFEEARECYKQLLSFCVRLPYQILSPHQLEVVNTRKFELDSQSLVAGIFDSQPMNAVVKQNQSANK